MTASDWVYWSRRGEGHPGSCAQLVKAFWVSLIKHLKMPTLGKQKRQQNKVTASEWVYWSRGRHPGSCAQLEEQRGVIGGCPSGPADKINWNLGKFTTRPTEKLRENVT